MAQTPKRGRPSARTGERRDARVRLIARLSRRRQDGPGGYRCPHCGARGRLDIVDAARVRAYLTCRSCGNEWETSRASNRRNGSA